MKTFFIVPGFGMSHTHPDFSYLKKELCRHGHKAILVPITWNRKTMDDYTKQLSDTYRKEKGAQNYIIGFSYGAVAALITANELRPDKIFLCSLSPAFKEDIPTMKEWVRRMIGKKRIAVMNAWSGRMLARNLSVPTVIFFGEKEAAQYPQLKKRCEETVKLSQNARLIKVARAPHDLGHVRYQEALLEELDGIL